MRNKRLREWLKLFPDDADINLYSLSENGYVIISFSSGNRVLYTEEELERLIKLRG